MPLALNKIRSFKLTSVLDLLLYVLENATEEHFWKGIFGERLARLLQRYFGNDFFMIGILFYLAPMLRSRWDKVVELVMGRFRKPSTTVSVRVYYYDEIFNAINYYVMKHTEQLPGMVDAVAMYEDKKPKPDNCPDEDEDKKPKIGLYPRCNTSNVFNYKDHRLWVSSCIDDEEKINSSRPNHLNITMDTKPGETIDTLKAIIQEWCDDYNDADDHSIKILRWNGYDDWVFKDSLKPRGYDSVNLPPGVKENLLGDMQRFIKRKTWYERKGLPHRRGFLLYGPPGTGKTSLIQALAGQLQYNLALIKLGEVHSDSDFSDMVRCVPKETLLIIEDVDHYDETSGMEVSKSGLLNALDGINGNDGAMVFMTCNDMNKITPALLRPGRMDVKLELGYAVHAQVKDMFWRFFGTPDYGDDDDDEQDTVSVVSSSNSQHYLPTPPNEKEQDERMDYLNESLTKLLTMIPENHVTTSELQNLFVTLFLESGPVQVTDKYLVDRLFERVPEFLERVQLDREQAKLHDKLAKDKDSDSDSDDDTESNEKDTKDTTEDEDATEAKDTNETKDTTETKDEPKLKDATETNGATKTSDEPTSAVAA